MPWNVPFLPHMFDMPAEIYCPACRAGMNGRDIAGHKNNYTLLRCAACRSVTANPLPTPAQLSDFYQNYHGSQMYGRKEEAKIRRARKRIEKYMSKDNGARFLDVGCNHGYAVKAALDLGWDAHGIDVDAQTIAAAAARFGDGYFTASTIENFAAPGTGRQFDTVYTSEVIEHVPDVDAFIDAISKLLTHRGRLFLTTPDAGHFRVPRRFDTWGTVKPPLHLHYFTKDGMSQLLRRHGFTVERFILSLKPQMKLVARKRF